MATRIIILLMVVLSSCNHQRMLNRKINRAEKFAALHGLKIVDTIHITDIDTFIVERYQHDTVTNLIYNDSVTVINNERLKVVYHVDSVTNNIHHYAECKSDTIIKPEYHTIVTEKIKSTNEPIKWWWWVVLGAIFIHTVILIKRMFVK